MEGKKSQGRGGKYGERRWTELNSRGLENHACRADVKSNNFVRDNDRVVRILAHKTSVVYVKWAMNMRQHVQN